MLDNEDFGLVFFLTPPVNMLNLLVKSPGVFCLLTEQQQVPDSLKNKKTLAAHNSFNTDDSF